MRSIMEGYNRLSTEDYFKPSYRHVCSDKPLISHTIGQLIDMADEKWGNNEAAVFAHENVRLSFKQVKEKSDEIAAGFFAIGLKPGDILAVSGTSCSTFYLAFMAARRAGLILACIDPVDGMKFNELALKKVKPKALIIIEYNGETFTYDTLVSLVPELRECEKGNLLSEDFPYLRTVITASTVSYKGSLDWKEIPKMATSETIQDIIKLQTTIQPDEATSILFTSGSTGQCKAVLLSHHMLVNVSESNIGSRDNCCTNGSHETIHIYNENLENAEKLDMKEEDDSNKNLLILHCFGHIGATCTLLFALQYGYSVIFSSAIFDEEAAIKTLEEERCYAVVALPMQLIDLVNYVEENNIKLQYPKVISAGGSPVTDQLIMDLKRVFPIDWMQVPYGQTESTGPIMRNVYLKTCTSERVFFRNHLEMKLVDHEEKIVPIGMPGHLFIRGYCVMIGYYNDEKLTAETITSDKWLKTGDIFIMEEDGRFNYVGRANQSIKKNSLDIYPWEIERVLSSHPSIRDVHVLGIPDQTCGEEICAFIKTRRNETLEKEEIIKFCRGKLADHQLPRYIRFVQNFPMTTTGKVVNKQLLETFKKK